MSRIGMRFFIFYFLLILPTICWTQSSKILVNILPVIRDSEEERKLDANGNPSLPFDVSSKVSELLAQSSDRIVFLFFVRN